MAEFGILFAFMIAICGTDLVIEAACDRFPVVDQMLNKFLGMENVQEESEE